jgi:hypothetical protein
VASTIAAGAGLSSNLEADLNTVAWVGDRGRAPARGVAGTHIAVGAGKTTAVTFRLNRTGVRLLRKFRKLRIAVLIVAHPNRGATVKRTKIITIRPPAKH